MERSLNLESFNTLELMGIMITVYVLLVIEQCSPSTDGSQQIKAFQTLQQVRIGLA